MDLKTFVLKSGRKPSSRNIAELRHVLTIFGSRNDVFSLAIFEKVVAFEYLYNVVKHVQTKNGFLGPKTGDEDLKLVTGIKADVLPIFPLVYILGTLALFSGCHQPKKAASPASRVCYPFAFSAATANCLAHCIFLQ